MQAQKRDVLRRLAYIEGHLKGVRNAIALISLGVGIAAVVLARPEHALGAAAGPLTPAEAGVRVELVSQASIDARTPTSFTYRLTDAATGAPVTDVIESHERPMHLIAVRQDLQHFRHLHPTPTGQPGEYEVGIIFPEPGTYLLFDEFMRAGGQDMVQRDVLTVGATSTGLASLAEDRAPKSVEHTRVSLSSGDLTAGQESQLVFRLEHGASGEPVRDLQPYLGAPAHVVILAEDTQLFQHTHGEQMGGAASPHTGHSADHGDHGAAKTATYGPEIGVRHTFPAPGLYKVWAQFRDHHDEVITADFVVRVN